MTSQQQKFQKKKDREKEVKKKVLRRRMAVRAAKKEEKEKEDALEQEYFQRREDPALTPEQRGEMLEKLTGKSVKNLTPEENKERDAAIVARLKRNIEYLEALEKEYLAEQESKERTAKILETQGAVTLEEKLELMKKIQTENGSQLEIVGA